MARPCILIVDDEPDLVTLLEMTLRRMELDTASAGDLAGARKLLARREFALCLTDMKLPDGNGIELVRHIRAEYPELPVAMITAYGNVEAAVESLKAGAFDFVPKPVDLPVLRQLVEAALRTGASEPDERRSRDTLLGESAPMRELRGLIARVARGQAPVYISGESGTGKELVARLIHDKSPRAEGPFVPVNCGAIPSELMESEFFGHKKGSFTGATGDKAGLFQAAAGGTLFLDEVAELPMHMQVKLLRAIQERAIRPVGESHEVAVDVRILSATHQPLAAMVAEGRFRQDLFYRINVIELQVPPLRERPEDIEPLSTHMLENLARRNGMPCPRLGAGALAALREYAFPGNVRELENILERAITLCDEEEITPAHLGLPAGAGRDGAPARPGSAPLDAELDAVERQRIQSALEQHRYNKTATARALGITLRALRYRMEKLGIE